MRLKCESPEEVVNQIGKLERRADLCLEDLKIYRLPRGLAKWATLVFLVGQTERHRATQGFANYDVALINLSRRGALILKWLKEKGNPAESALDSYRWNSTIAEAVNEAFGVASNYLVLLGTFPLWHQDRMLAELTSSASIRFMLPGGESARRVSAFHKGFRPYVVKPIDNGLTLKSEQQREMDQVRFRCLYAGQWAMAYSPPINLYRMMMTPHLARLQSLFRRDDSVDLGPYAVGELKQAYSALAAVCAVHEYLCYRFGISDRYPLNSCVLIKTVAAWTELLSEVSGLDPGKVASILNDLTISDRVWDFHVQPIVPVDKGNLAIAPQFALHSRIDENILRVCGYVRKSYFDVACSLKEEEMLDDLLPVCPKRFVPKSGIRLPGGLPDIDLLLSDEEASVVLIGELKWLRKPFDWRERIDREEDFKKGLEQLLAIRAFLEAEPKYLTDMGKLPRSLDQYAQVVYALIARDHFCWPDKSESLVVDYDVFKQSIGRSAELSELVGILNAYEWLPKEGRDFVVKLEPAVVNGVTVESEIFRRIL